MLFNVQYYVIVMIIITVGRFMVVYTRDVFLANKSWYARNAFTLVLILLFHKVGMYKNTGGFRYKFVLVLECKEYIRNNDAILNLI